MLRPPGPVPRRGRRDGCSRQAAMIGPVTRGVLEALEALEGLDLFEVVEDSEADVLELLLFFEESAGVAAVCILLIMGKKNPR